MSQLLSVIRSLWLRVAHEERLRCPRCHEVLPVTAERRCAGCNGRVFVMVGGPR